MDGLSLAANIIAVVGAAKTVVRGLQMLKDVLNAPEQLLQILNEVSDFQAILVTAQQTANRFQELDMDSELVMQFAHSIDDSAQILDELLNILQGCFGSNRTITGLPLDVSRKAWFKGQSKIRKLSLGLRKRREDISSLLNIAIASSIPCVRIDLDRINFTSQELHKNLREQRETSSEKLKLLEENISAIRPQLRDLEAFAIGELEARKSSFRMNPPGISSPPRNHTAHLSEKTADLQVQATMYRQTSCNAKCLCHCHRTHTAKTPKLIQDLIGSLFIGYSNTPINRKPCNEKQCKQQRFSLLKINYYFPSWFMHRMVAFKTRWTPLEGHQISVRTPRVVNFAADVFLVADHGNLDSLKILFSKRLASPFDVSSGDGQSALQTAVDKKRVDICEFLLAQYADPEQEDIHGNSSIDMIWDRWLQGDTDPKNEILIQLFSSKMDPSSDLQKRNFTVLHQSVLRLNSLNLEDALQLSTSTIDAQCSVGRTPLTWAILRSQTNDVRLLVEYGADITLADREGQTPLHRACKRQVPIECLEILLSALSSKETRPNLNPVNVQGYTPFQYTGYDNKPNHATLLLSYCTPSEATHLIEYSNTTTGAAALQIAIQYNSHSATKLFLSIGARTDGIDVLGLNVLHLAAVCADLETISILADAAMEGLIRGCKLDERDSYGFTPLEDFDVVRRKYVEEDQDVFMRARELFLVLLGNVREKDGVSGWLEEVQDGEEDGEVFFDTECFGCLDD